MSSEKIEGIGSFYGGEYDSIAVEGIGKLKGDAAAKSVVVEGLFKGKGRLITDQMVVEGVARCFRNIKSKYTEINGVLKLRRADLNADKIVCDGIIVATREVSADEICIDGSCSVAKMYGDKITITNNINSWKDSKIPIKFMFLMMLYFGRKISLSHCLVDILECTDLTASGLKSKIIRAGSVKLKDHCIVGKLICDGEIIIDDTCQIGEIISNNSIQIESNNKAQVEPEGKTHMESKSKTQVEKEELKIKEIKANTNAVKIMDLYKNGKISADEAEKMLAACGCAGGIYNAGQN
ncbi:MAG TPA: hypothetical protein PK733_13695 [Clostridiales bacterium]|nr:hypothetical protein [Clostridiales bacterium]